MVNFLNHQQNGIQLIQNHKKNNKKLKYIKKLNIDFDNWDEEINNDIDIDNIVNILDLLKQNEKIYIKVNKKCQDLFYNILLKLKLKLRYMFFTWHSKGDKDFIIKIIKKDNVYHMTSKDNEKYYDIDLCNPN